MKTAGQFKNMQNFPRASSSIYLYLEMTEILYHEAPVTISIKLTPLIETISQKETKISLIDYL